MQVNAAADPFPPNSRHPWHRADRVANGRQVQTPIEKEQETLVMISGDEGPTHAGRVELPQRTRVARLS